MPAVDLAQCDIAMYSDPETTRIVIPRLVQANPSNSRDVTLVQFDGEDYPTAFRGTHKSRSTACVAYWEGDVTGHEGWFDLVNLFDTAFDAPDGRLILRTNRGLVAGLDPLEVVNVSSWSEPRVGGLVWSVTFAANRVHYSEVE